MRSLRRAVRASILDRRVHTELFFDSDATADAVLVVAGISALVYAGRWVRFPFVGFSVTGLLSAVIFGLIGWLLLAGATWLVATKLFDGSGQLQTMMRLHGHCELPLVLGFLGPLIIEARGTAFTVGSAVGLAWSIVAKIVATREGASLSLAKALAAVLLGLALVAILRLLFRLPFMAFGSLF